MSFSSFCRGEGVYGIVFSLPLWGEEGASVEFSFSIGEGVVVSVGSFFSS